MSIGAGIFLLVVGAILAFALDPSIGGGAVDLQLVGYFLMAGGAVVAIIGLAFTLMRRTRRTAVVTEDSAGRVTEQERIERSTPAV